jgi:hypothetical protein
MRKVPCLVTYFNRPEALEVLLPVISRFSDAEVYFASDGPKNSLDASNLLKCQDLIEKYFGNVPEKRSLTRSVNLGCRKAMKENIDWFFGSVEFGLILEDDCIPNDDFFSIVSKGLMDYKDHPSVISISGSNCLPVRFQEQSHTFKKSVFPMVWGWGGWASKWSKYDFEIEDFECIVEKMAEKLYGPHRSLRKIFFTDTFKMRFHEVTMGHIDTWDYSLTASAWRHNLVSLQTNSNFIVNRGFSGNATHTKLPAPSWVPTNYGTNPNLNGKISTYTPESDLWLAENVFNCTLRDFMKNRVKRIVRT